jgi:hypothetical protein
LAASYGVEGPNRGLVALQCVSGMPPGMEGSQKLPTTTIDDAQLDVVRAK